MITIKKVIVNGKSRYYMRNDQSGACFYEDSLNELAQLGFSTDPFVRYAEGLEKRIEELESKLKIADTSNKRRLLALQHALEYVKDFLVSLENGTPEDDPLRAMRVRFHKSLHEAIDAALKMRES